MRGNELVGSTSEEQMRELRRERDRYRDRCRKLERDIRAMKSRRWWRLGVEGKRALREPWRVLVLPLKVAMIMLKKRDRNGLEGRAAQTKGDFGITESGAALEDAKRALRQGRYQEAGEIAEHLASRDGGNIAALEVAVQSHAKRGAVSEAARTARRLRERDGRRVQEIRERMSVSRVRELSEWWLPRVPGSHETQEADWSEGLRVLHFLKACYPYEVSGATIRSLSMLRSQRRRGLNPVVLTDPIFGECKGSELGVSVEKVEGVRHYHLNLGWGQPQSRVPLDEQLYLFTFRAADVVRSERPAILHASSGRRGYENAMVALALRAAFSIPVIYEVRSFHEATWTGESEWAESSELYTKRMALETKCMRRADAVVTLSEGMRAEIISRGVTPDRVWVVPNALDPIELTEGDGSEPEIVRRTLGLEGKLIVGYVSNLSWREGHDVLLRAIGLVRAEGYEVACLIVGDGPERERLEELARALGIDECVIFTGPVPHEEVAEYYDAIDVFVVPRRDDRAARLVTPLKPFEAMGRSRPMIVSDLPALREIVPDSAKGLVFEPENPADLAARIQELLRDSKARRLIGEAGREWVVKHRNWDKNAEVYERLYNEVMKRRILS